MLVTVVKFLFACLFDVIASKTAASYPGEPTGNSERYEITSAVGMT